MLSNEGLLRLGTALLGVAFGAGGAMFILGQVRRDLNGLGRKYGRVVALLIRWADSEEKRMQIADMVEGK